MKFSRAEITISLLWFIASIAVGMVVAGGEGEGEFDAEDDNRRRTREERGLPSNKALRSLARTYLETQRRLWPELVDRELPSLSKDNINKLAGQFKQAFLTGGCIAFSSECRNPPWKAIAAGYFRYSCDNSNPRSLDQQLKLALERAKQDGHFLPWTYVFADAAVSGTTAGRTGYTLIKDALCTDDLGITAMYIDEIGRASRDMVQALLLGRLMDKENKRLIGVSDGFDSIAPMWKTILSIFAALQEWFVDQLRAKVKRGMDDAFGRGDNTHAPGVGYKLIPTLDASGKPVVKANGRQKNTVVIDEDTSHYVLLAFRLFTERKRSPDQIGKYFNRRAVDGKTTWDGTRIRSLLSRYKFVGIRVRGRYLQTVDPDTGNVKTKQRPKSEWKVRRSPELQIVPWSLWKKAQQRKQECKRAYSSEDQECQRTDAYPTTLVRPICGVCNKPLWLGRSGKYASFCCINGRDVKNGCTFRGYKSVCIVENAVLSHVKAELLSGKHVESLTLRTNEFLKQEAAKPKQDVTPITRELRQLRTKIERITDAIEEGEGDVTSLMRRQKSHGKRIEELNAQLRDANIRNEVPQPLDADVVRDYINQLRELLQKDVAQAAPIIRQLTGPVVVHQVKQKGKKKAAWIAKFRSNLIPVVMELARSQNCPTKSTLAYLCTRTWTMELPCEIRCESIRAYERIAPRVVELIEQGASIETIARVTETSWTTVQEALDFAKTGNRPKSKPTGKKDNKRNGPPRHQVIADEVARRREAGESFAKISKDLSVSASTATRAFDFANREQLEAAAEEGETPRRGHWRRIPAEKINEVRRLLHASKLKPPEIARRVGVSPQTVRRERDAIRDEE